MTSPAQQPARTRPRPGDELELSVDALAFGGDGIARADGYVVFVAGAIPGDRVRARVFKAKRASATAKTAGRTPVADRARREVDRARRAAGVGPNFPILGYEDLTAGQVTSSLGDLTPAELRKVRDYERRHANRKSVLNAVEKKLA